MSLFDNVTALARTTVRREVQNTWMRESVLYWKLTRDGRKKPITKALDGGKIRFILAKEESAGMVWYKRGGTVPAAPQQILEGAEFEYGTGAIPLYLDGIDMDNNLGSEVQLEQILKKNAVESAQKSLAVECYNDGSDSDKLIGINGMMTVSPYGGLTTAEVADWTSQSYTATTALSRDAVDRLWTDVRSWKVPDLGLTTPEVMAGFRRILSAQERFTDPVLRKAGFQNLMWNNQTPIVDDPYCTGSVARGGSWTTATHLLAFLNTQHIDWIWHPNRKLTLDEPRYPEGKEAKVLMYKFGAVLATDWRSVHGYWSTINPTAA
jgi:hypothetical protein